MLSIQEAAAALGCSVRTVYNMIASGKLRPRKRQRNGRLVIPASEIKRINRTVAA